MKPLAASLLAFALGVALQAQSAPPSPPRATSPPYRPRPLILINPRDYLATPAAPPRRRATPRPRPSPRRHPLTDPTPQVFEHLETARSPNPRR